MKKKVLKLTLKKMWYDLILLGVKQEEYSMLSIHSSRTIGTVTRDLLFVRFSHARTHACSMLLISHTNMRKGMHRYRQSQ